MSDVFASLQSSLAALMPLDRHVLRRRLQRLQHHENRDPQALAAISQAIQTAQARREQRQLGLPKPDYPEPLPILDKREEILAAVRTHPVIILCGETGSGKSTQLPKLCLELGRGVDGYIGHTQPRRLAARSIAERLAYELHSPLGQHVGYKVRFKDQVGPNSYIKVMTDGILLAETQTDRLLHRYDTLIIDEAHERSLNIDFILGYLRHILPQRPDLKIIITSATIDPQRFAHFFSAAPIIEVSGRSYPVEIRYRPRLPDEDNVTPDMAQAIAAAVAELHEEGPGDVLVFLPGERDIRQTAETLRKQHPPHTEILPLYARLSIAEQQRLFAPHSGQRIVLATNVAETSITVPGIRYVIDTGQARISRYSYRNKIQRLPIENISQASAKQRAGRCGRVAAGICIRLYEALEFESRPAFTDPEILRTNLASVILQMYALRLGKIEHFDFLDQPDDKQIRDGYRLLEEIGALLDNQLTPLGKQLTTLPLDPRLGRIVLAARSGQCLHEILIIVSGLSVQDPRERPLDKKQQAQQAHAVFTDKKSDFIALLNLWNFYQEQRRHLTKNKLRKLCSQTFLSATRLEEWHEVHQQLHGQLSEQGAQFNQQPADYATLHKALLTGLASQIGMLDEERNYLGPRGIKFQLFPTSGVGSSKPKWIVAGALMETAQLFAHTVAEIDPAWVEETSPHLIKHDYSDPHWQASTAQVGGYERVSLYGLVLCAKRRINFGPIDPVAARELFIREALIHGHFKTPALFLAHNQRLIEEICALEQKTRRPDILVDEQVLFEFYSRQIPENIYSGAQFTPWYQSAVKNNARLLFLEKEDVMQHAATHAGASQFPDSMRCGELQLPLTYHFAPGDENDGVTAHIPLAILNLVSDTAFDWLVPGLRKDKLVAMIKALPKALRRHFIPAPDYADACLAAIDSVSMPFNQAITQQLRRMSGVDMTTAIWSDADLPVHLHMRFEIHDDHGETLAHGRDLAALKAQLKVTTQHIFDHKLTWDLPQGDFTDWPCASLPHELTQQQSGQTIKGYPAFVASAGQVSVRVFPDPIQAQQTMRTGLHTLLKLHLAKELKYLIKNLPHLSTTCLAFTPRLDCTSLTADLLDAILYQEFLDKIPFDYSQRDAYEAALARGKPNLVNAANQLANSLHLIAQQYQTARAQLAKLSNSELVTDINQQLEYLVYPGFISQTPPFWREHLLRYLKGINARLDKARHDPRKDHTKSAEVRDFWMRFIKLGITPPQQHRMPSELTTYRWLIEEYRIVVFAQELKTAVRVSAPRLEQQWQLHCRA
jgi:ATP-dependent helicase HrpA